MGATVHDRRPGSALSGARAALVRRALGRWAMGTGARLDRDDDECQARRAGRFTRESASHGHGSKFTRAMGTDGAGYDTFSTRRIQLGNLKFTHHDANGTQCPAGQAAGAFLFSGLVQAKKKLSKFATMLPSWNAKLSCCTRALAYLL